MSKKSIQVYKKESRKNVQEPLKIFIAVAPFWRGYIMNGHRVLYVCFSSPISGIVLM